MLRRSLCAVIVLLLALGTSFTPSGTARAAATIDPVLAQQLTSALPTDQLIAIANFDPAATTSTSLSSAIQDVGAGTLVFEHLDSVGVLGTAAQLHAVAGLPGVTELYANRQLSYFLRESVPYIEADRAWNELGVTGAGIGVAILDSGVDATHRDLAYGTKTVQNVKILYNQSDLFTTKGKPSKPYYLENVANTDSSSGHGTHVAGIAAGSGAASAGAYTGVAKDANIVGIGTGDTLFIIWALAGFDYLLGHAAQYNIKVVNNSWGTSGGAAAYDPKDPINRASKKAHDKGITVVFAAGNDGPAPDTMNPYSLMPWVISVAAGCKPLDRAHCSDGMLADFSSRGVPGSSKFHPTLTAPGAHIVSTRATTGSTMNLLDGPHDARICNISAVDLPSYTCASGTSMASPHVAGVVALLQQAAGGKLSPDQVKAILVKTARPMVKNDGTPYALFEVGAGYLDAYDAVAMVKSARKGKGNAEEYGDH